MGKPVTPHVVLTASPSPLCPPPPPWCLSKNLEEYFWNEVSNILSHFY